ncbi:hypothetical protein BCON_0801g00010 [Botryotinia convoluta]|uniref:Uncharacterized protein n=1 Tax=Botryotinia convoluta TaxID=54673 RepID=A0A4Z1H5P8_9HELO|nr:hypothetical protein BCON_0801g00010 [Botryotinia convoluta]
MPLVMRAPSAPGGPPTQEAIPPQPSTIIPGSSFVLSAIKERFERIDKIKREKWEVIEVFAVLADKLAQGFQGQQCKLAVNIKGTIISTLLEAAKATSDRWTGLTTEHSRSESNTQKTYTDALKTQMVLEAESSTKAPPTQSGQGPDLYWTASFHNQ